ncbi:hypothetical protein QBC37DRAFT_273515 [Rhypophila decipiens]|uniref:RRM domain-containing protein n=1 Tax=Rhypophila decipiens TaxID=261697 RepID=A0AAN7BAT5_9PEZI|nr:hypothetical protein QBC37DRAFT_273515 [Rhypophila decipiens]
MNGEQNTNGASSVAPTKPFAPLSSSRASPFLATVPSSKNAMAATTYMSSAQGYRPSVTTQQNYSLGAAPGGPFDRDANSNATKPVGTPYSAAQTTPILIRNLPLSTTDENLRFLLTAFHGVVEAEVLPADQSEDPGFRSALVKFNTVAGAQTAKDFLHGQSNTTGDATMVVEIMGSSPTSLGQRSPLDSNGAAPTSAASSSAGSATASTTVRQPTRYNAAFQSLDGIPNGIYSGTELTSPDATAHSYQNLFSPQSPIGNHLSDRTRVSGKSLINNDSADDDETGELLKDPVGFAESGMQRRQTAPQIPISRMGSLSLNTAPTNGPSPMSHYSGHPGLGGLASHHGPSTMSPSVMGGPGPGMGYHHPPPYRSHNFPPANPADQNPPCNTLYVGNLPIDTSEEELKAMFSKQRGYKRLCFRTKGNGPMCFVEFEDVSFATKALNELYGQPLHNSVKGGIRLSFSKNPLGVRSGQTPGQNAGASGAGMNGLHPGSGNAFTTANGPPPGLTAPPGLSQNRSGYSASPGLGNGSASQYASPSFSNAPNNNNLWGNYNGHPSMMASTHNYPAHMMGR